MSSDQTDQPLDPELKAMFDNLRPVPPRNAAAAAQGKANFMAEVDTLVVAQPPAAAMSLAARLSGWAAAFRARLGPRAVMASLAAVVVLVLIFGSVGMTALAAQSALPGDALYPVKTGLEDTRAGLTRDASRQVEMYLQYAQIRLDEMEQLIDSGRYDYLALAAEDFQMQIQNALRTLDRVSSGDPAKAIELATRITQDLNRYAQALSRMAAAVPTAVRPEIEKVIETSRNPGMVDVKSGGEVEIIGFIEKITPDGLVVDGQVVRLNPQTKAEIQLAAGLMVKVQAMIGIDGVLTAQQIEAYQVMLENGNLNMNGDDQVPGNLNGNEAQDQNGNQEQEGINAGGENSNSSREQDRNENWNQNQNENRNENDRQENDNNRNSNDQNRNENRNQNNNDNGNKNEGGGDNENSHGAEDNEGHGFLLNGMTIL